MRWSLRPFTAIIWSICPWANDRIVLTTRWRLLIVYETACSFQLPVRGCSIRKPVTAKGGILRMGNWAKTTLYWA